MRSGSASRNTFATAADPPAEDGSRPAARRSPASVPAASLPARSRSSGSGSVTAVERNGAVRIICRRHGDLLIGEVGRRRDRALIAQSPPPAPGRAGSHAPAESASAPTPPQACRRQSADSAGSSMHPRRRSPQAQAPAAPPAPASSLARPASPGGASSGIAGRRRNRLRPGLRLLALLSAGFCPRWFQPGLSRLALPRNRHLHRGLPRRASAKDVSAVLRPPQPHAVDSAASSTRACPPWLPGASGASSSATAGQLSESIGRTDTRVRHQRHPYAVDRVAQIAHQPGRLRQRRLSAPCPTARIGRSVAAVTRDRRRPHPPSPASATT